MSIYVSFFFKIMYIHEIKIKNIMSSANGNQGYGNTNFYDTIFVFIAGITFFFGKALAFKGTVKEK